MDEVGPINVLISLHKGYGLGDAVQMSSVLRHVVAARPNWDIDYQAEEGKHQVGQGIVTSTFAYERPYPSPRYDAEVQILLYDTWANWHDRPNTRVSSCLRDRFGLDWVPSLGRYQVYVSRSSTVAARTLLSGAVQLNQARRNAASRPRSVDKIVAVHYQGISSPERKDLTHRQADEICCAVEELGGRPVVLDWMEKSPLPHRRITTPAAWGRDAEMVCAVIGQCAAFVGIDSGPSKCASATGTPALVVWTGHHPAPFHDPAPNTTHLVPADYHGLEPVCNDPGVIAWFEAHYKVRMYEFNPVYEVKRWLAEVLA